METKIKPTPESPPAIETIQLKAGRADDEGGAHPRIAARD